jgi:uncharacterized protein YkwD
MDRIKKSLPQPLWRPAFILGGLSALLLLWRSNVDSVSTAPLSTPTVMVAVQQPSATPTIKVVSEDTRLLATATPTPKPPTSTPTAIPVIYTVEEGDVAVAIAASYGIAVESLLEINNISDPTTLQIGQTLQIPVTVTPTPSASPTPKATATPTAEPIYHIVELGDTLLGMAIDYETSVETIMLANEILDPLALQIGQKLLIPPNGATFAAPTTIHVIAAGDTLLDLAIRYGSTLDDITTANPDVEPTQLQIGQRVIVPLTQVTDNLPSYPSLPRVVNPEASPPDLVSLEQLIINATNAQRLAQGLAPYAADEQLMTVARAHAQDMTTRGYFSHVSPEGTHLRGRLKEHGLELNWVGENILRSTRSASETPQYTINWFMADRPHRLNLLHSQYNRIGVGVTQEESGWYIIVQVFAAR